MPTDRPMLIRRADGRCFFSCRPTARCRIAQTSAISDTTTIVTPVSRAAISEPKRTGPVDPAIANAPAASAKPAIDTSAKIAPPCQVKSCEEVDVAFHSSDDLSAVASAKADADIHARARTAWQPQVEAEAMPVSRAGRHVHHQPLRLHGLTAAVAGIAWLAPHLAAPAARRAGARHVDVKRDESASEGLVRRDENLGVRCRRRLFLLDEIAAEEFDRRTRGWKIDRDFIGKRASIRACVGHDRLERDSRCVGASGTKHLDATIEAALRVVKQEMPRELR